MSDVTIHTQISGKSKLSAYCLQATLNLTGRGVYYRVYLGQPWFGQRQNGPRNARADRRLI